MSRSATYRGRIAPTPSGLLHVGHAATFITAWKRARGRGGKIVLRMEDIDRARCRPEYSAAAARDISAIGLDWDEGWGVGGKFAPYEQSLRLGYYWSLVEKLSDMGFVYPCEASRAEIAAAGKFPERKFDFASPEKIFPPEMRSDPRRTADIENPRFANWRFAVPFGAEIGFCDNNCGQMSFAAGADFGDFLVWRKSGEPSYELAVVADDAAMEITEAVRGMDLLLSTARQILLYRALGFSVPEFFHCPLVRGGDGAKLSKSSMSKSSENKMLICNLDAAKLRELRDSTQIPQA